MRLHVISFLTTNNHIAKYFLYFLERYLFSNVTEFCDVANFGPCWLTRFKGTFQVFTKPKPSKMIFKIIYKANKKPHTPRHNRNKNTRKHTIQHRHFVKLPSLFIPTTIYQPRIHSYYFM